MRPALWQEVEALFMAAMELPEDEQRAYIDAASAGRPDLKAEVESLLGAHAEAGHFLADPMPSPAASWIGRRVGPYRILSEIGHGGMGTVFLAEREDQFHKHVAIKFIGSGALNADLRRRFLEERQILATFEHPNIARLLDGGVTDEGTPYMVMEFVEGVPITEYSKSHALGLRARLEIFRTVCLAVHYAHQHLVVHRDIKPGNILVTGEGAPILLDFGIAKILNPLTSAAAATHAFLQPLTPDYASPEQLRGDAVTTATDVYSLGILLYELLTGTRPFSLAETTLLEAIRIAGEVEPPKPSMQAGAAEFSEDLDHIVLKAIRKEPQERYASAREFAEDVARYLDGMPVMARRRSVGYVVRKTIGRHRVAFALAAAAFILIVAGVSAIAWEAHVANQERAKAQKRFDDLHSLARSVIFELHDGIARLAGSTEVRKTLVTRALAYLDSLAKDSAGDLNLQSELVEAYHRIGDVQGKWSEPNLGDPMGALASYRKGLEIAEALRARSPRMERPLLQAASLDLSIGEIYVGMKNAQQAQKHVKLGLDLLNTLPKNEAARAPALLEMFQATRLTDPAAARPYLEQAAEANEFLLAREPSNRALQGDVALVHRYLATYESGEEAALRHLNRSLQLDEQRQAAAPADARTRLDVSFDLMEIGHRYLDAKRPDIAMQYYARALTIRQELSAADPMNVMGRARVAFAYLASARARSAAGDLTGAIAVARKSADAFKDVAAADPTDKQSLSWLVEAYTMIGRNEAKLGHREQACSAFGQGALTYPLASKDRRVDTFLAGWKTEIDAGLGRCNTR